MGKKILICDPKGRCVRCPLRHYMGEESDIDRCGATQKIIPEGIKQPEWCPLKDMPERITSDDVNVEFANGWNAAVDKIELG